MKRWNPFLCMATWHIKMLLSTPNIRHIWASVSCVNKRKGRPFENISHSKSKEKKSKILDATGENSVRWKRKRFSCLEEQRPKAVHIVSCNHEAPIDFVIMMRCENWGCGCVSVCLQFCHLPCVDFDDWRMDHNVIVVLFLLQNAE